MQRFALLGRDYPDLGSIGQQALGVAQACISAGQDAASPSFVYKGDATYPNEDGLVILNDQTRWLFAVADGHLGHHTSHALLEGLKALPQIPARLGPLSLALSGGDWIEQTAGGSTLLVACLDAATGSGFGLSFGDSSLVVLGPQGARLQNTLNSDYLRGGSAVPTELGQPFQFQLRPGETLLLYTDGINECCYRDPHRSVGFSHLEALYAHHGQDAASLARALIELALVGVDGHSGGQDNAALIAFPA